MTARPFGKGDEGDTFPSQQVVPGDLLLSPALQGCDRNREFVPLLGHQFPPSGGSQPGDLDPQGGRELILRGLPRARGSPLQKPDASVSQASFWLKKQCPRSTAAPLMLAAARKLALRWVRLGVSVCE